MTQQEIFKNMTKEQIAYELRDIECGIGALLAVISECEIKIPEEHPDPTAIPDCINLGKEAHASINKLQIYWDSKGINPESVQKIFACLDDVFSKTYSTNDGNYRSDFTGELFDKIKEALTAAKL